MVKYLFYSILLFSSMELISCEKCEKAQKYINKMIVLELDNIYELSNYGYSKDYELNKKRIDTLIEIKLILDGDIY